MWPYYMMCLFIFLQLSLNSSYLYGEVSITYWTQLAVFIVFQIEGYIVLF